MSTVVEQDERRTVTNWVGFELVLKEHALGLTERRAAWVVKWARETAAAKVIHFRAFEEALGRIVFATSALELLRPFLAPLYASAASGPRDSVRPVPAYVAFFLRFLAGAVERERHSKCAATLVQEERAPRVDAQASDDRTGVGGWLPAEGPDGRPDPSCSYWFSKEIRQEDFRWVFKRDGKAARVIAMLEALAMLLAIRAFFPNAQEAERTNLVVIPSYTDNRRNGALLNKLMSSKYPLSALLMEFGEQLRHSEVRPDVRWAPREANREADRLRVIPPVGRWFILDETLVLGETAENEKKKYQAVSLVLLRNFLLPLAPSPLSVSSQSPAYDLYCLLPHSPLHHVIAVSWYGFYSYSWGSRLSRDNWGRILGTSFLWRRMDLKSSELSAHQMSVGVRLGGKHSRAYSGFGTGIPVLSVFKVLLQQVYTESMKASVDTFEALGCG